MDPNWVPKPNKINKNSNEICGKVQRIVSNTNAYNRISVVWGGGDDTPHGVFDKHRAALETNTAVAHCTHVAHLVRALDAWY